eukprot:4564146-Heterocapsa_arctica.AAC.1
MPLIIEDEVRRVVNNLAGGKAKGVDGWSPAELRALSRTHIKGFTSILNNVEQYQRWPHGLHPIIALIAKEGADNEGQLRPIAMLLHIYRVWIAVRKTTNSDNGRSNSTMADSSRRKHWCGELLPEVDWPSSEEHISRQRTLTAVRVMKESITTLRPLR